MREANDPRIAAADVAGGERSTTRLDERPVANDEPKPRDDASADAREAAQPEQRPPTVLDATPMEAPEDDADQWLEQPIPAYPLDAEQGIEMEDTSLLYNENVDMPAPEGEREMVAFVDVLQTLGADPVDATRYAA